LTINLYADLQFLTNFEIGQVGKKNSDLWIKTCGALLSNFQIIGANLGHIMHDSQMKNTTSWYLKL